MRYRTKNCDHCGALATVCYRIQYDETRQWRLVCPVCQKKLSQTNPFYRYGGTWKAKKKK